MVPLYSHLNHQEAELYSLVLNSVGIGNRVVVSKGSFRLDVPPPLIDRAAEAIDRYRDENPVSIGQTFAEGQHRLTTTHLSGIVVALLLLAVHLAVVTSAAPKDYVDVFGADSYRILRGEIYRCGTALLLHADAAHIAGNMVGMILFGGAVSSVTGTGVGWLMILASGFFGNWLNAFAYDSGHLSIGASTSVFGAVGMLCALQAVLAKRSGKGWKRVGLALGGGLGLLAFLGSSTRSDLGAHLFGFILGVLMGSLYGLLVKRKTGSGIQWFCGTIAIAVLFISWGWGAVQ